MKCIESDDRVNYVDRFDQFAGFELNQQCCERAGHFVTDHEPTEEDVLYNRDHETFFDKTFFDQYYFADEIPKELSMEDGESGGAVSFRLRAEKLQSLWICFFNMHYGYHAHTLNFKTKNCELKRLI